MKVMKFGGTSVGKPERMHQVAQLITQGNEPVITVLSALSGTTNALVERSNALSVGNKEEGRKLIEQLEGHYQNFIQSFVQQPQYLQKAKSNVAEHFEFLHIITRLSFSDAFNKDILAQGELMSTRLFSVYLEEQGINHVLLPALEFMRIDANEEPY
jgi:aspartate kinase